MRFLLSILFCVSSLSISAACLNQPVSISCSKCSLEEVLDRLESKISCSFSYSSDQLDPEQQISVDFRETALIDILKSITNEEFNIQQKGRYVLMTAKRDDNTSKTSKKEYIIEGYVKNASTGEMIQKATVYAVGNKYSALTNEKGYYKLALNTEKEFVGLSYSKRDYFDTIIVVKPIENKVRQDIILDPREAAPDKMPIWTSLATTPREVEELTMVKFLVPEPQRDVAINLDFLEQIPVQFSLVPSIGTNRFSSGMKTNVASINLLAGYNAAIEGVEVGGLVNITRTHMHGLQASGLGNIVGGEVRGIQAAGLFNNVRGSVYGVQAAGLYNIVLDTVKGVQAAGFFNVLRGTSQGGQLSGFLNVATENMTGLQAAGFLNYTKKDVKFVQAGGFMNVAGSVSGAQTGGFANFCKGEVTGVQAAGFMNIAETITGVQAAGFMNISGDASSQISGFLNVGKTIDKIQVGIFNFSDSSALSIGLFSFSLKGLNRFDFHSDEIHPYNISYRTGNQAFYNILQVSYGSYVGLPIYSLGYGIGTEIGKPEKRVHTNLEVLARQVRDPNNKSTPFNLDWKFEPSLSVRIGKKRPSIVFGPSLHIMFSNGTLANTNSADDKTFRPRSSYPPIYDAVSGPLEADFWVGAKFGVRI